ncbi:MAG TPA: LapA family protein [Candidatus Polarisedimenticolaceae bacterium]|nr:LapA family protein [Candidatus Polarisedimenticolaceae bacterium]
MRLLVIVLTILLFVGFLFFVMDNLDTEVQVRLGKRAYPSVQLFVVVLAAIFVGMVYAGIIAVAEGANARLANRRLAREVGKLETELNYLRTQRPGVPRAEPDKQADTVPSSAAEVLPDRASAPVYGGEGDWTGDDDDAYSGGRAV